MPTRHVSGRRACWSLYQQARPGSGRIDRGVTGTALGQGDGLDDLLSFIATQCVINHCIFSALELGPDGLGMY